MELARARYAQLYGPTVGDRVRLADTDLLIEVTEDRCGGPGRAGEEAVFGGGKVLRESMGQGRATRAEGAPDLVITGAVVLDHWGVVKADVGIRDGRIVALGKAGNPDTMDGVHPGPRRRPRHRGDRRQRQDPHRRRDRLPRAPHLPADRARGARRRASRRSSAAAPGRPRAPRRPRSPRAPGTWPGCSRRWTACRSTSRCWARATPSRTTSMWEQLRAGASGFKLHEDWGTTPAAIDACLTVADAAGVQAAIHTDTLNEAGFVESTLAAIARPGDPRLPHRGCGRRARAGHHHRRRRTRNVLPSSTNPTRPHTVNTLDEHLDMLMVCHHLNPSVPEDLAFAESRIRPSTIAAEDLLHDLGAISMIGSDAQAMGRVGEVVLRTWQTAHVMKRRRGFLPGETARRATARGGGNDNLRARRYVAKYTICPAVAHGMDGEIGSVEPGKLADLVLWDPAFFGVRPHVVIKGGMIAWAADGRRERLDPDPAAGAAPADVRCRAAGGGGHDACTSSRRPRSRTGWPTGSTCGAGWCRRGRPRRAARPTCRENTATPRHPGRPRHLHRRGSTARSWAEEPGDGAADGPALLPVLRRGRWRAAACRAAATQARVGCGHGTGGRVRTESGGMGARAGRGLRGERRPRGETLRDTGLPTSS